MFVKAFQGYNCYSSAVGECAKQNHIKSVEEIILTQWTYFFDEEQFFQNQWCTGAAKGPVDELLKSDLMKFGNVDVKEEEFDSITAIEKSKEALQTRGYEIVLVDFYYLNSFNWKSLSRFGVTREHDPHYIILQKINDDTVEILDSFYHHKETMTLDNFMLARSSETKQGKLNYNSYEILDGEVKEVNAIELLKFRFGRYLEEQMSNNIRRYASVIEKLPKESERIWAFTGYNCLNQITYQHQNLSQITESYHLVMPEGLDALENEWATIRKLMFQHYSKDEDLSQEIVNRLMQIADREEAFTEAFYKKI